jgi:hypothetical protein
MPLSVIKRHYRIQNSEPDSDSVHFHPADPNAFAGLQLGTHLSGPGQHHPSRGQTVRLLHPPEDLIFTEA